MSSSTETLSMVDLSLLLGHDYESILSSDMHIDDDANFGGRRDKLAVSASFLAEISVRSPRKIVICIIFKKKIWIKVSQKKKKNENRSTAGGHLSVLRHHTGRHGRKISQSRCTQGQPSREKHK